MTLERWPDFLVIGGARCGTTALHYALANHSGIAMTRWKEPRFFALEGRRPEFPWRIDDRAEMALYARGVTEATDYWSLFPEDDGRLRGEVSPIYIASTVAAERIAAHVPEARLVAILREPIDRAYSHFVQHVSHDKIPPEQLGSRFVRAVHRQQRAISRGEVLPDSRVVPYVWAGLYAQHLSRYLQYVEPRRLLTVFYDALSSRPHETLRAICDFVGASRDPGVSIADRLNVSGIDARAPGLTMRVARRVRGLLPCGAATTLGRAYHRRLAAQRSPVPALSRSHRSEIAEYFVEDVLELVDSLGLVLPNAWNRWHGTDRASPGVDE